MGSNDPDDRPEYNPSGFPPPMAQKGTGDDGAAGVDVVPTSMGEITINETQPSKKTGWRESLFPSSQVAPGELGRAMDAGYVPSDSEAQAAMVAHIAGALVALFSGGVALPIIAPLIGYLVADKKGPFLIYHVNQAVMYQAAITGIALMTMGLGVVSTFLCFLVPLVAALGVGIAVALVYAVIVGLEARKGEWKPYPIIGEKLLRQWKPILS